MDNECLSIVQVNLHFLNKTLDTSYLMVMIKYQINMFHLIFPLKSLNKYLRIVEIQGPRSEESK